MSFVDREADEGREGEKNLLKVGAMGGSNEGWIGISDVHWFQPTHRLDFTACAVPPYPPSTSPNVDMLYISESAHSQLSMHTTQ